MLFNKETYSGILYKHVQANKSLGYTRDILDMLMGNADIMGYNLYNHTATPWDMVIPICILIWVDECILDLL